LVTLKKIFYTPEKVEGKRLEEDGKRKGPRSGGLKEG
jgi:hypothetical protein